MGIPRGMGFSWESMGTGIAFGLLIGIEMEMGITTWKLEWRIVCVSSCSLNDLVLLYRQ